MALTPDQVRIIDQLRQRLSQLSTSIQALQADLSHAQPLPTPASLQQSAQLLAYNQAQVQALLSQHRAFFTAAHSYPLPSFPGHTQEGLLIELMRKKLEPRAEAWIDRYTQSEQEQSKTITSSTTKNATKSGLSNEDARELWSWAGPTSNGVVRALIEDGAFEDDFTLAERRDGVENVVTGLKRSLLDSDDEEEEEEEGGESEGEGEGVNGAGLGKKVEQETKPVKSDAPEKMEDVQTLVRGMTVELGAAPMPIDKILRFMSTAAG